MRKNLPKIFLLLVVLGFVLFLFFWREGKGGSDALTLYGNVDIRQADLGFRVFGKVTRLRVDEGDTVIPGQLLAEMDPKPYLDALEQARGRLESSEAELANAEQLLLRRNGLPSIGSISEESYDEALFHRNSLAATVKENRAGVKLALQHYEDTQLVCPSHGTILSRVREPGTVVQPGETIFVLSVASPVWVRAYVSEPNLGRIYPGMRAKITTDTPSNPVYEGHIGFISPVSEFTPKNVETTDLRTDLVYRLRVVIDRPDEGLRQGMPVTVTLEESK